MGNNGCVCSEIKPMVPLDILSCPKRQTLLGMKFWE